MFRSLLNNWLRQVAMRRAQNAVGGAFDEHAAAESSAAGDDPESLRACHVGVIFALEIEAGGLIDRLTDVIRLHGAAFSACVGRLGDRRVVVSESGPGGQCAAQAAATLIAGHRPDWIISAGFAGGLQPGIARGDFFVASAVATEGG